MFKSLSISAAGVALIAGSLFLASPTMARFVPRDAAAEATHERTASSGKPHRARTVRARGARHAKSNRRLHRHRHGKLRADARYRSAASRIVAEEPAVIIGTYPGADRGPQAQARPVAVRDQQARAHQIAAREQQAQERRPERRGFAEVPRSPRSLLVTSATAPLPFKPGCSDANSTDHLGYGWFMLVATRTCFVR